MNEVVRNEAKLVHHSCKLCIVAFTPTKFRTSSSDRFSKICASSLFEAFILVGDPTQLSGCNLLMLLTSLGTLLTS